MFKNLGLEVIRMKKLFELLKQTNKLIFTSSSLCRSEMNWNYTGEGSTIVSVDNNKIHFLDRITLDNRMSYEDKKLWVFDGEKVEFWHDRGNSYEKIFEFSNKDEVYYAKEFECGNDTYMSNLTVQENDVLLMIQIKSDKKNEVIEYKYYKG